MSETIATLILIAIAAIEVVVWIWSLRFVGSAQRDVVDLLSGSDDARFQIEGDELDSGGSPSLMRGVVEVEGPAEGLCRIAAQQLARGDQVQRLGMVRIDERRDDRIAFRNLPSEVAAPNSVSRVLDRGVLSFRSKGAGRTQITYELSYLPARWMLRAAKACQVAGILVIASLFLLLYNLAVPSLNPGARFQVIQMVQGVHLLWVPFMLATRYKNQVRNLHATVDAFLHNLPYAGQEVTEPH